MNTNSRPIAPALATLLASTHISLAQTTPAPVRPEPGANADVVTLTGCNG